MIDQKKIKFTQISNICLYDKNLSLDARGLMCILLSYPKDWSFYNKQIIKTANIGEEKLKKLFHQLEINGYIKRTKQRDNLGKFKSFEFKLCDEGTLNTKISIESTTLKTPSSKKSSTDKSVATNTNITNTNYIVDVTDDNYKEKMNELNQKLLEIQLNKDMEIQRLENLAVSKQNRIDF